MWIQDCQQFIKNLWKKCAKLYKVYLNHLYSLAFYTSYEIKNYL
jgi:hypothetical protein